MADELAISPSTSRSALVRLANDLANKYERNKATIGKAKVEAKRIAKLGVHSTLTVAGGAAHGALTAKMPTLGNTNVSTGLAAGTALVLAGVLDLAGDYSEQAASFGSGLLAAEASRASETWMRQR